MIFVYLRIHAISIDLFSKSEKKDVYKRQAKNYAGFLSYKKEPDMTRIARCIVANYNSGITRFGESSGVMYCKACDEKCTQKCVEARAALTPDRLNKRQNGRRFKEDGEPELSLIHIYT